MNFPLCEARLRQYRLAASAADAETVTLQGPPAGKVWVIIGVGYMPSVAETQVISFKKVWTGVGDFCLLNPISLALNPALATFIEQGMEYLLFPGESLAVHRGGHTAGSTMALNIQLVELDLPLYDYDEPQVVKRQVRAVSQLKEAAGPGGGTRVSIMPVAGPKGGGPRVA